ncbi:MAG: hypothetical protein ACWIPI_04555 [Polaribacter sp.]
MEGATNSNIPESFINIKSGFFRVGTIPTSSTDSGQLGQMEFDSNYFYYCYGVNQWNRIAKDNTSW